MKQFKQVKPTFYSLYYLLEDRLEAQVGEEISDRISIFVWEQLEHQIAAPLAEQLVNFSFWQDFLYEEA